MRLERLGLLENAMTSAGIESTTFWLVAYCFNQLRYRVPKKVYLYFHETEQQYCLDVQQLLVTLFNIVH
jgi:hypothetical protein